MVRRAATAKDVAHLAGVSRATVSYVVNDNPNQRISPETRERVLAAVAELGYTPSATARALRKGAGDVVLLALPNGPLGPTLTRFIETLEAELARVGVGVVTRRVVDGQPMTALWRPFMPAAVVGLTAISAADARELRAAGVFVAQAMLATAPDEATMSVPQTLIGRLQVEHLASRGHRVLGYAEDARTGMTDFLSLRRDGVRQACVELGLDLPVAVPIALDAEDGARAVTLLRAVGCTAVCAYNDEVAFVVLAGMRLLGLTAPADLAVIGVDDIPLAPFACPPLTTVNQNIPLVSRHLAALLRAGISGEPLPAMPRSESLTLVVRESA